MLVGFVVVITFGVTRPLLPRITGRGDLLRSRMRAPARSTPDREREGHAAKRATSGSPEPR
jgi:hypothetical protein